MSELENIKAVLDYLDTVEDTENHKKGSPSFCEWIKSEKKRLAKEYFRLSIIDADDKDIISQALIEMSSKYNMTNQFQVSNKIDEVRKRFLDNQKKPEDFKWTDLKLGDILRMKNGTQTCMVTAIDTSNEPDVVGDICHIYLNDLWVSDKELEDWEKVE